ncbi:hypothetical protein LCGC14_1268060, partial [marine sediment metagenome]
MRILFDTNIIIDREDNKIISEDLQILINALNKLKIEIVLHPKSVEDVKRDKNSKRKEIMLSKIRTYPSLKDFPKPSEEFLGIVGRALKVNDIIDRYLLFAVFSNAVNFLISEDIGIHKMARVINLSERVLKVVEALELFKEELPKEVFLPPALQKTTMANLDINDSIFDSLRKEYPNFNKWFVDKAREGRD